MRQAIEAVRAETVPDRAPAAMPLDFHRGAYQAITDILPRRLRMLKTAFEML